MQQSRDSLKKAIDAVLPGLAIDAIVEQADKFLFTGTHLVTFNDEICVSYPFKTDFKGAVKAAELRQLLNKLPADDITMELSDEELIVKGRKMISGIVMDTEMKSAYTTIGNPKKWHPIPAGFFDGMKLCRFTASPDNTQPVLGCVHVHGRIIETCDRYRFTRYTMDKEANAVFPNQILIPADTVSEMSSYSFSEVGQTEGWVHLRGEYDGKRVVFICRVFEGTYPDLDKHLIEDTSRKITLPDGIEAALQRAGIFSPQEKTKSRVVVRVRLTFQTNKLVVYGEGPGGWFKEHVPMKFSGEQVTIEVNSLFLAEVLKLVREFVIGERTLQMVGDKFTHVMMMIDAEKE